MELRQRYESPQKYAKTQNIGTEQLWNSCNHRYSYIKKSSRAVSQLQSPYKYNWNLQLPKFEETWNKRQQEYKSEVKRFRWANEPKQYFIHFDTLNWAKIYQPGKFSVNNSNWQYRQQDSLTAHDPNKLISIKLQYPISWDGIESKVSKKFPINKKITR